MTTSDANRWQHFNVSRLFDQAELDRAYNLIVQQPMPPASIQPTTDAVVDPSFSNVHTQIADALTSSSPLSVLLSPSILSTNASAKPIGPASLFQTQFSSATESPPINSEKDAESFDTNQLFSGLINFDTSDREALYDFIQDKVMSSCSPKQPSALRKRIKIIEKIHEAQELNKTITDYNISETKEVDLKPRSDSRTKPVELSPAVALGMNAFLLIRDRLDLTEPQLCKNLIATLRPVFSDAFSSNLSISSDSPIIAAVVSFLDASLSNSGLEENIRSQALEILFQLYIGQASASGILRIVKFLLQRKGAEFCHLHLAAPLQELSKLVQVSGNVGLSPELYSFGRGDTGRLGQGSANVSIQIPQVIDSLRNKSIVNVATFSTHSLAISDSGDVFAWGNAQHGRLGTKSLANAPTPIQLKPLINHRVVSVAVGLSHSVLLTDQGRVFSFGNGVNGRLGTGDTKERRVPTIIQALAQYSIVGIACGSAFTFALGEGGSLFSWGKNTTGQCGHGNLSECQTPRRIAFLANESIVHIAGGWDHALACSARGVVYSWGCGYEGTRPVLGNGSKTRQHTPTALDKLYGHHVVKVAAGYDHSLAICDTGIVFAWGSSAVGQLGLGDTQERLFPEKIQALSGLLIVSADGGMDHTLFITNDGEVYACGNGAENALGVACSGPMKTPQLVESLKGKYIKKVACGDKCSIVLSTSRLQSSTVSNRPLRAQQLLKLPGLALLSNENSSTVDWKQVVLFSMSILDISSAPFAPQDNMLWDDNSLKPARSFERFAIDIRAETFECLAEILDILQSDHSFFAEVPATFSGLSIEGRSENSDDFHADEIFGPFILITVLHILKIHIWHVTRANSTSDIATAVISNASLWQRLQKSILTLMKPEFFFRIRSEWSDYIKKEASEIFVLGVELWFPNQDLYAQLLSEVISGNVLHRFPNHMPFGVSIQDALMKRLSETSLLQQFLQSNHESGKSLVSILLKLISAVQESTSKKASQMTELVIASADRKDSGTNPDVSLTWIRSPLNLMQKITARPSLPTISMQRGDISLLIAFQQALLNKVFRECVKDDCPVMLSAFPSHHFLTTYAFALIDHCCEMIDSSCAKVTLEESLLENVLPIFITSLHCFSKNVFLCCSLLDKLKLLIQRLEHAQVQMTGMCDASWVTDLEITTIELCGRFLSTLLELSVSDIAQFPDDSEVKLFFARYGSVSKGSSTQMQVCAMRYFVEILPLISNFLTLDAILTCMLPKVVMLSIDPGDWELASIMETFYHLLMGLCHRSALSSVQQQALTMRVVPYLTGDFVVHSSKMHADLGILTFLRDCIWRIQYAPSSDTELSSILYEVHQLAVRVFQSIILKNSYIVQPATEALLQELSSAATWSLSTAALKSVNSEQQGSSPHTSAITLIGPSRCWSSECIELPNIFQEPVSDFTLSAWMWISSESPVLFQFKGQSPFFSVSLDSVRGILGTTEVRHASHLEPNQWTLVTLVAKNRQLRLFVDDSLSNQQTVASGFPSFPTDVPLVLSGSVQSRICGLRWWKEALATDQVAELFQEGPHGVSYTKGTIPFAKSFSMAVLPDTVPYEYLCLLNCMTSVSGTVRNSLNSKWTDVLLTLLKHGTVRMKIVILRTISSLLCEKDLTDFEPLLWTMCNQLWMCNEDGVNRPEDSEICIRQESISLYQRLLKFSAIRNLLTARLRQCVDDALKTDELSSHCLCALSVLGGSLPIVTVGSYVSVSSNDKGMIVSLDQKTGICSILVELDPARFNDCKSLKRFVLRQELASKCLPVEQPSAISWTPDIVSAISLLIIKSVDMCQEIICSDVASSKHNIFWANIANQSFNCLVNLLYQPPSVLNLSVIEALQVYGVVRAVAQLASTPLPQTIQPKFRSSLHLKGFLRSVLVREKLLESRASMIIGSGRRGIIPVQIVSSLESLGLIPLRSNPVPVVPHPDPQSAAYKCPGCSQQDLTMPTLLVHFQKHHSKTPMRSECPLCSASSLSIPGTFHPSIANHFRRHHKSLAANGSDLPVSTVSQDAVAKLMAMGFEVDHCIYALEQNNEDLVAATNWILNNLSTVGALVEAKKAAAAAAAASSSQGSSSEDNFDRNNPYEVARKQANEDAEASSDYLELGCGFTAFSLTPEFKASSVPSVASSYLHTLLELTVMTARHVCLLWVKLGHFLDIDSKQYLNLLKLTVFRGQIHSGDHDNADVDLAYLQKILTGDQISGLVDDVVKQIALAVSDVSNCLYEEVPWGSRITECTDLQAVDDHRLCLERTLLFIRAGIAPQVIAKGADLIVKCLYNANVHIKMLACTLLNDPSADHLTIPIDRVCLLLSRCLIQDHSRKQAQSFPFTSSLLNLCTRRVNLPTQYLSDIPKIASYELIFDDLSPLKVSEDGVSAIHMMDGVWLSAASKQPFFIADDGSFSGEIAQVSFAFQIGSITNHMISFGITTDPNEVSCTWVGSSDGTCGIMADGSIWVAGRRTFSLDLCFEPNDVLGFIIDLRFGTASLYRNGTELGQVFRNLRGTIFPCISLFFQSNSVSFKKGWKRSESSAYAQDLESAASEMHVRSSRNVPTQ